MLFPLKGQSIRLGSFFFIENLLIFLSVLMAVAFRFTFSDVDIFTYDLMYYKAFVIAAICQISFYYNDLYTVQLENERLEWVIKLFQSLATLAILLAVIYYLFPSLIIGRGILLIDQSFIE